MAQVELDGVSKRYPDGTVAVRDVSLTVPDGDLCVLVGPSGCGKTTLLRMVAGLEGITGGDVRIAGARVNDLPPKHRDVAMVFQNYALYPHMSVYDNIGFGLRMRGVPAREIDAKVRSVAAVLGLEEYLARQPRLLSGGQRQRVAMGRAMVREPQVLLMDEPLSNLDAKLRVQMRTEIGRRQRDLGLTTVYVTHDQTEAMTLGDRVAVFRHGVMQQLATPQELFERPANMFVAGFIGSPAMNLLEGRLASAGEPPSLRLGSVEIALPASALEAWPGLARHRGGTVYVGIRPEDVARAAASVDGAAKVRGRVEVVELTGRSAHLHARVDAPPAVSDATLELMADVEGVGTAASPAAVDTGAAAEFTAIVDADAAVAEGARVEIAFDPARLYFFDPRTGVSLSSPDAADR